MLQKHNPFIYTCKDKSELNSLDHPEDIMLTEIKCDPLNDDYQLKIRLTTPLLLFSRINGSKVRQLL